VTDPLVRFENVDLRLGQGIARVHVLKNISLALAHRETVGIVGPSGSGKSTLLMVLAGLERIDSGHIWVDGTDIAALDEDAAARFRGSNIGIVFQSFHLIANMTALENTAVPLELAGQRDAFDVAAKMLSRVGLGERLSHYPSSLSGGEQQRVALARALAPNPKIIIADEPTGNLDQETGRLVADLIFEQAQAQGTTMMIVTHDGELAKRCDRQIHLQGGEIDSIS